jgi:hypothetical protein
MGASTGATIAAVTDFTVVRRRCCCSEKDQSKNQKLEQVTGMLSSIFVVLIVTGAIVYGVRPGRNGKSILRRPYNNPYNDAAGARDDRLG